MYMRRVSHSLMLLVFLTPVFASGEAMYNVSINTSAVGGSSGQLAFDFTTDTPSSPVNDVSILNFATNGTMGLPQTQGGLVSGDIILGRNPAPLTTIESHFFFNELLLNYTTFGTTTTFSLQIGDNASIGTAIPDEFALFLLQPDGTSLFPTSDPTGADALFTIDSTGVAGGLLTTFNPTVFTSPTNLSVQVLGTGITPEPGSIALVSVGACFAGLFYKRRRRS
jgi:hypothetical protein